MPSRGSKPPPSPAIKVQFGSALCIALDASYNSCNAKVKERVPGCPWCPRHYEERIKLYVSYKSHHAALDAFPEHTLCQQDSIPSCTSLETLRAWNEGLRTKYQLLNRCIMSRSYFTERFFGNDMDFGHKTFWEYLLSRREEVENLMTLVELRAYELILASQNALWVLDRFNEGEVADDCCGMAEPKLAKRTPPPPLTPSEDDIEDPIDVAIKEKCATLWIKIRVRLAQFCAPSGSRHFQQRKNVIFSFVRRAIYRDPSLVVAAQSYKNAKAMLDDSGLELSTLEKLWKAMAEIPPRDIQASVDDVLRPDDGSDYVIILGGKVYKDARLVTEWPIHAWGHLATLWQCYSCLRRLCNSVDDIVALTRYTILSGGGLNQSQLKYNFNVPDHSLMRALLLCGFVPNDIGPMGPRYTTNKCNCAFKRNIAHWEETKNNYVMCAGLSLSDPNAQAFVNACLRHPDLKVMVRKGPQGRVIRSSRDIGAEHFRHSNTRAGLRNALWETKDFFMDSLLQEALPVLNEKERLDDCLQVAIVDDGEGEFVDFLRKLVGTWCTVYGVEGENELAEIVSWEYFENGSFEFCKTGCHKIMYRVEEDVNKAYRNLWGVGPPKGIKWVEPKVAVVGGSRVEVQ